jgi:EAL domain-containing protein (putative c-di-GMP-specific phosphodiesterase class I)
VETKAELDFLKNVQCDAIQGFLFSRPLTAKEFYKLAIDNLKLSS